MAAGVMGINVPMTVGIAWRWPQLCRQSQVSCWPPFTAYIPKWARSSPPRALQQPFWAATETCTGAIIGGLIFGVVETMAAGYISSAFKDIISFGVLILVLFVMPHGILKVKAD